MSYEVIDGVVRQWVTEHGLFLDTRYREEEVRSIQIVSAHGDRFQIWIDRPRDSTVPVHGWDYKRRRIDVESTPATLSSALDLVHQTINEWISANESGRTAR